MSDPQHCGNCKWFQEDPYVLMGKCTWKLNHPQEPLPTGINLRTMPNWGRYCDEWEQRNVSANGN